MSAGIALKLFLIGIFALGVSAVAWSAPPQVSAQCGDDPPESSCSACHDDAHAVYRPGEWHTIHAGKDCCWNCHGGNDRVADKDLAHVSLVRNPLEDTYISCHQCHPDDYRQRADRFARILGVTPASRESITQSVALAPAGGQPIGQPVGSEMTSEPAAPWLGPAALAIGAFLFGLALVWRRLSRAAKSQSGTT